MDLPIFVCWSYNLIFVCVHSPGPKLRNTHAEHAHTLQLNYISSLYTCLLISYKESPLLGASVSGGPHEPGRINFAFLGILTNSCCVYMCLLRFDAEQCFSKAISDLAHMKSFCQVWMLRVECRQHRFHSIVSSHTLFIRWLVCQWILRQVYTEVHFHRSQWL